MRFNRIPYRWTPLPPELADAGKALGRILLEWEGTPYLSGSASKHGGVDCVRFVCAVYRELEGRDLDPHEVQLLPPDAAMHSRAGSMAVMRYILRFLDPIEEVTSEEVQPGDILVVGPENGGPGHAMLVSPWKNVLFHAATAKVTRTGWIFAEHYQKIFHVFRKGNRECWR